MKGPLPFSPRTDSKAARLLAWPLALALALAATGGLEAFWRNQGHRPSVTDDMDLWALHRGRVYDRGRRTLVLVGASRAKLDFSLSAMERRLPEFRIVQLAIDGTHPMAALRDLASDEDFSGVVLCSAIAPGLERRHWDHQQPYVDHFRKNFGPGDRLNRTISAFLQERLAVLNPHLKGFRRLFVYCGRKAPPRPFYLVTRSNRSRDADYSKLNVERHRKIRIERLKDYYELYPPYSPDRWLAEALETDAWIGKILSRGGRVVFARLPTSGEHWELDEKLYPRREYWDRFAEKTRASTIHFQDAEALSGFPLPDLSHLDAKDKDAFTDAFIEEILKRGFIDLQQRLPRP